MTANPELLPCPFCGHEAVPHDENDEWIKCSNPACDACQSGYSGLNGFTAAEAWNRRVSSANPSQPDLRGLIERMRGQIREHGGWCRHADETLVMIEALSAPSQDAMEIIGEANKAGNPPWTSEQNLAAWFKKKAALEGDLEVGAGVPSQDAPSDEATWQEIPELDEDNFIALRRPSHDLKAAVDEAKGLLASRPTGTRNIAVHFVTLDALVCGLTTLQGENERLKEEAGSQVMHQLHAASRADKERIAEQAARIKELEARLGL